jgi:hypothetical protein
MKKQDAGFESRSGQAAEGIAGYGMRPLDVPLGPTDIAAIRRLRKEAQARLRELIDKDTVDNHG